MKNICLALALFISAGCAYYHHQSPSGDATTFNTFLMLGKASRVHSSTSETNGYKRTVSVGSVEGATEVEKLEAIIGTAVASAVKAAAKP